MTLPQLDDENLELIIRTQLEDLQSLTINSHKHDDPTGEGAALEAYRSQLQALESHRAFCQHIANGGEPENFVAPEHTTVVNDASSGSQSTAATHTSASGLSVSSHSTAESLRDEQREALRKLDELTVNEEEGDIYSPPGEDSPSNDETHADGSDRRVDTSSHSHFSRDMLASLSYGGGDTNPDQDEDELSNRASEEDDEAVTWSNQASLCVACDEACGRPSRHETEITGFVDCPCGHQYCKACLEELVRHSITDESLFPPRCCRQGISIRDIRLFLPLELVKTFEAKTIEYNTKDRTYCHQPNCSTFIPTLIHQGPVPCPECSEKTCTSCKGAAHEGKDCPEDPATKEILQVAKECGWQRCYSCHRMVELSTGCNHITCRCGAEFCYLCGKQWRNCECAHVTEEYLWARAEAIVDRNRAGARGGGYGTDLARRQMAVQREMTNQTHNHDCRHPHWVRRRGEHQCEECHDTLLDFIFECIVCRTHACNQCRLNRI